MNFRGLIKRAEDVDKAIQDLQIDLADALDASLDADDLVPPESDDVPDAQAAADGGPPQAWPTPRAMRTVPKPRHG
ncbi:hypothetical protein [Mesorhizobium sp. M7A.F.Ca.MR.362.00.0.0]|uniref:hypothetical protein n=1 Tax=Mesorhizobium sp. M7A.F.Ca.MR.362.00.0.0 TaxID=2496779 RepID=UPI001FE03BDD|nr:hypothetical protein [Mesorhizobium sp. M7A.F.Ca.MR.362.00.0.0]